MQQRRDEEQITKRAASILFPWVWTIASANIYQMGSRWWLAEYQVCTEARAQVLLMRAGLATQHNSVCLLQEVFTLLLFGAPMLIPSSPQHPHAWKRVEQGHEETPSETPSSSPCSFLRGRLLPSHHLRAGVESRNCWSMASRVPWGEQPQAAEEEDSQGSHFCVQRQSSCWGVLKIFFHLA